MTKWYFQVKFENFYVIKGMNDIQFDNKLKLRKCLMNEEKALQDLL